MKNKIFLLSPLLLLAGCFSFHHYKAPEETTIENEKFINKPLTHVWSNTLDQLLNSTFTTEKTDYPTGTIVSTFKTDRPINYIDCGIEKRTERVDGKPEKYTYNLADESEYKKDTEQVHTNTSLITKITTTVTKSGTGSNVAVNIEYILKRTIETSATTEAKTKQTKTKEIKFSTNKPYKSDSISCTSNGTLETNILHGIN